MTLLKRKDVLTLILFASNDQTFIKEIRRFKCQHSSVIVDKMKEHNHYQSKALVRLISVNEQTRFQKETWFVNSLSHSLKLRV